MNAIQAWWSERKATAYSPYLRFFTPAKTPTEVLDSIYNSFLTDDETAQRCVECRSIEDGMASLISESEFLSVDQEQQLELLQFAGMLSSAALLRGFTCFVQNLPPATNHGGYNLVAEAFFQVQCAGYGGEAMTAFLKACKKHVSEYGISAEEILKAWARHDPENWATYLAEFNAELAVFASLRTDSAGTLARNYFIEDLVQALGTVALLEALATIPADQRQDWLTPT